MVVVSDEAEVEVVEVADVDVSSLSSPSPLPSTTDAMGSEDEEEKPRQLRSMHKILMQLQLILLHASETRARLWPPR